MKCDTCANKNCPFDKKVAKDIVLSCDAYKSHDTNYDRIRAMSVEELANKLAWRAECPDKFHQDKCNEDCFGCWLDWLNQEVSE